MQPEIRTYLRDQFQAACDDVARDLDAMSHEQLSAQRSGVARTGYNVAFEVAFVSRRLATRIRGAQPPTPPNDGWMAAPPEWQDKARLIQFVQESRDELLSAWDGEADPLREIILPSGERSSPLDLMFTGIYHTGYHDAQLNYIQTLDGDSKMHAVL